VRERGVEQVLKSEGVMRRRWRESEVSFSVPPSLSSLPLPILLPLSSPQSYGFPGTHRYFINLFNSANAFSISGTVREQ
jgi:hypothetical protein